MSRLAWLFVLLPCLVFATGGEQFMYPNLKGAINYSWANVDAASTNIAAANDEVHMVGRAVLPTGTTSAVCSTAGSVCTISFTTGATITWATAGSAMQIGIQDVSTAAGNPARGDGTFDVSGTMTQGTETAFAASTAYTASMETGSKTITHGDLIAIAFKFTVRNGADAFGLTAYATAENTHLPLLSKSISASWSDSGDIPNAIITADDGTKIWLDGTLPFSSKQSATTFNTGSSPDEYCLISKSPPVSAKLVGAHVYSQCAAGCTATVITYTDPTGTPTAISGGSVAIDTNHWRGASSARFRVETFASPPTVAANTTIATCLKSTNGTNTGTNYTNLYAAGDRVAYPGGTDISLGTRNCGGTCTTTPAIDSDTTKIPAIFPVWESLTGGQACRDYFKFGGSCF